MVTSAPELKKRMPHFSFLLNWSWVCDKLTLLYSTVAVMWVIYRGAIGKDCGFGIQMRRGLVWSDVLLSVCHAFRPTDGVVFQASGWR